MTIRKLGYNLRCYMKTFVKAAFLALAAPALICLAQPADQPDVAAILQQRYVDQTLILRRAVDKNKQVYDSGGTLLSGGKDGPWTIYAGMMPKAIILSVNELRLEGDRQVFAFNARQQGLSPMTTKQRIKLAVKLSQPLTKIEDAEAVLHRVFALTDQEVIECQPEIWKPYLRKRAGPEKTASPQSVEIPQNQAGVEKRVYQLGMVTGITPPRAVYTPEPEFTEFAREFGRDHSFRALVVINAVIDENGRVTNPTITQPAGMGLDEKAIEIMKSWRFHPATRDGQPVNVAMSLEVQFNLYESRP